MRKQKEMVREGIGAGKSRKKMLPGGREKRKESRELCLLPCCSWLVHSFRLLLCFCRAHTHMLYLKHHLGSLQGLVSRHLPGGAPGSSRAMFLFQFPARWGRLVSYTPQFYFLFFTGGNWYACTLLTLNIWYMFPGRLVESSDLYPRNWLFDHRLIRVGKYHFWNDSLLRSPQQSHFSSQGTHFKEPDGAYAVAELCVLSSPP